MGLGEQHAHLRKVAREHEVFDQLQKRSLIVEIRLEVGGIDGNEPPGTARDLIGRSTYLSKTGEHTQRLGALARCADRWRSAARFGCIARISELRERTV